MMNVRFDRSYWPGTGTTIETLRTDLNILWENFPDQASIFVAEALIEEPPSAHVHLAGVFAEIYLWTVGGDALTIEVDLVEEIARSARGYSSLKSDAQADDVRDQIAGLDKMTKAIESAKQYLEKLLADYSRRVSE